MIGRVANTHVSAALVCVLAFLLGSGGAALAASVEGNWEGTVRSPGGKSYRVAITIEPGQWGGTILYKDHPCGGNLVLSHSNNGRWTFIKALTFGEDICEPGSHVRLTPQSDDEVLFADGDGVFTGTMKRSSATVTVDDQPARRGTPARTRTENDCAITQVDEGSYDYANNCGPFGNLDCTRGTVFWTRHRYDCRSGGKTKTFYCEDKTDTSGWMPKKWKECSCSGGNYYAVTDASECLR